MRTQGAWSDAARARLDGLLMARGAHGTTDEVLSALRARRDVDAVYVCVGTSCSRKAIKRPASSRLPVRETGCLGPCRLGPNAHRVVDGTGATFTGLDEQRLDRLAAGSSEPELVRRRWRVGDVFLDPALHDLAHLIGHWRGPGGFGTPEGCVRSLDVMPALGGAFLELCFENAWPTVVDRPDRFPERLLLKPTSSSDAGAQLEGHFFDYRGTVAVVEGRLSASKLVLRDPKHPARRHVLEWKGTQALSERHEQQNGEHWKVGLCASLRPVPATDPEMLR